jgi:hypothetical protein
MTWGSSKMYLRRLRHISVALLQGYCRPLVARTMITALRSVSAFAVSATVAGSLRRSTAADTQELAPKSPKSETAMPVELCLPDLPPLYIRAHGVRHVMTPHPSGWPWLSVPAKDYEIGVFSPIGSARYTSRDLSGVFVLPNSPMAMGLARSALRAQAWTKGSSASLFCMRSRRCLRAFSVCWCRICWLLVTPASC